MGGVALKNPDDAFLARKFLREGELGGLMYVDHHDFLRSFVADYPLATTLEQLEYSHRVFANFAAQ